MKRILSCCFLILATILPAQSIAVTDAGIQLRQSVWSTHNPNDGSNIGGTMPLNYGMLHESIDNPTGMQLYAEGPSWSTMMAYTQRPLYFNQPTTIELDFDATVLDNNGYLLETDLIPTVPVPNTSPQTYTQFNMSLQVNYATGTLQNVNSSGPWIDIANAKPGRLAVGKHHYSVIGTWNVAANTYGLTSVTLDGVTYPVIQNSVGHVSTWKPGISIQFQITAAQTAKTWTSTSVVIDNVTLIQSSN